MPANGPYLVSVTLAAIALLLVLILWVKLHAFLAMMLSSMALGLAAHMTPAAVLKSIQFGFGDALGFIAVVVALGAMIGRFLEHSGGGVVLADWLLEKFGRDRAVWAVLVAAYLVGLPIFFEVGFIILVPLVWSLAQESKRSLLLYGMPMIMALTVTHTAVPPHPGPAAAAQLLGADIGRVMVYGIVISFPLAVLGGIVYGGWIARRLFIPVPEMALAKADEKPAGKPPDVSIVLFLLILPVLLIFLATISEVANVPGKAALGFLGHPFTALMVTTAACMYFFGLRAGLDRDGLLKLVTDSLLPTGTLIAIMGGGGAFKQVIVDAGVGPYAGRMLSASGASPILVSYIIAFALRFAQGSATVAIITAAGIMAPIVKSIQEQETEFAALEATVAALAAANDKQEAELGKLQRQITTLVNKR